LALWEYQLSVLHHADVKPWAETWPFASPCAQVEANLGSLQCASSSAVPAQLQAWLRLPTSSQCSAAHFGLRTSTSTSIDD